MVNYAEGLGLHCSDERFGYRRHTGHDLDRNRYDVKYTPPQTTKDTSTAKTIPDRQVPNGSALKSFCGRSTTGTANIPTKKTQTRDTYMSLQGSNGSVIRLRYIFNAPR